MRLRDVGQLEIGDLLLCQSEGFYGNYGDILSVFQKKERSILVGNLTNIRVSNRYHRGIHLTISRSTTQTSYLFNILKRREV